MKKLLPALFLLFVVSAAMIYMNCGLHVTVKNVDSLPVRSVVVFVSENSYAVGDIGAGETKRVQVSAAGESDIEIEHAGGRFSADTYFEGTYRGDIRIEITAREIVRVDNDTR